MTNFQQGLVSCIVPVYNLDAYIDRCLDSILNQTYKVIEIIVVDDGSSDTTAEKVALKAANDSRIRFVSQENAGVSVARNTGLDLAQGEYVMFVDGDDWIEPEMVENMVDILIKNNADIAKCGFVFKSVDSNRQRTPFAEGTDNVLFREAAIKAFLLGKGISVCVCGGIMRRDLIEVEKLRFQRGLSIGEDGLYTINMLCRAEKVILVGANYYNVSVREISATRAKLLPMGESGIERVLCTNGLFDQMLPYYNAYRLRAISSTLIKNISSFQKYNEYKDYYNRTLSDLDFSTLNSFYNRNQLDYKKNLISLICKSSFLSYYLVRLIETVGLKILR